jgi:hypothetical protein
MLFVFDRSSVRCPWWVRIELHLDSLNMLGDLELARCPRMLYCYACSPAFPPAFSNGPTPWLLSGGSAPVSACLRPVPFEKTLLLRVPLPSCENERPYSVTYGTALAKTESLDLNPSRILSTHQEYKKDFGRGRSFGFSFFIFYAQDCLTAK